MESEMTNRRVFTKEFTRQEHIPEAGIQRALELMQSGRLHRYNTAEGEESEVALLEKEYAEYVGARYCVALNSCGSAMYVALKSVGVKPGDRVLCNAFTLAPVPGAIVHAGAEVVLVEIGEDYVIDLDDLEKKAEESGAGYFLISHMRGHVADMDAVVRICDARGIRLVEDCAHTMGCRWGEHHTGTFGKAGCFSTQTYKHMNSGEGGLLITDDDDVIARAILYSGSYMFYEAHISRPTLEVFERHKAVTPNFSLRMNNIQAAVLRPQLKALESTCARWNQRYALLERELNRIRNISVPTRDRKSVG
jgi:dTDP-4-amino-4,6-dideoxygalactose transaminase